MNKNVDSNIKIISFHLHYNCRAVIKIADKIIIHIQKKREKWINGSITQKVIMYIQQNFISFSIKFNVRIFCLY